MNFTAIQKNRIDNEIQEVRDKRNVWLTAYISTPLIFVGLVFSTGQGGVAMLLGFLAFLILNSKKEETQKELELKINELKKLERKSSR